MGGTVSAPIDVLNELRARGVELRAQGNRLRFRPVDRVTPDLLARLREHKAELLAILDGPGRWARRAAALLSTVANPGIRADLRELFEHRAAVCEFDGGLSRTEAERIAFEELAIAMEKVYEST